MNTRPKTMTPRMTEAVRLYRTGMRCKDAAAQMGLSLPAFNSALQAAAKRIDFRRDRPDGRRLGDLNPKVVEAFKNGKRAIDISREFGIPYSTVHTAIRRARSNGKLPPRNSSSRRYTERLRDAGAIDGIGRMGALVDTLTDDQISFLLKQAPKARTLADAVAIHLALTLPEDDE